MADFRSPGCPIYYESNGTGEPALLFVHGYCRSHEDWDNQLDYFRSRHREARSKRLRPRRLVEPSMIDVNPTQARGAQHTFIGIGSEDRYIRLGQRLVKSRIVRAREAQHPRARHCLSQSLPVVSREVDGGHHCEIVHFTTPARIA